MSKFWNAVGTVVTGVGAFCIAYQLLELNKLSKETLEQISDEEKLALKDLDTKMDLLLKKMDSSWIIPRN
jgi:hypothetical protein